MREDTEYTVAELFAQALEDESWEADRELRKKYVKGLNSKIENLG